jgi:hypothetical protein
MRAVDLRDVLAVGGNVALKGFLLREPLFQPLARPDATSSTISPFTESKFGIGLVVHHRNLLS